MFDKLIKHECKECGFKWYTDDKDFNICPLHERESIRELYNFEESEKLRELKKEFIGRTVTIDGKTAICLDVIDLEHVDLCISSDENSFEYITYIMNIANFREFRKLTGLAIESMLNIINTDDIIVTDSKSICSMILSKEKTPKELVYMSIDTLRSTENVIKPTKIIIDKFSESIKEYLIGFSDYEVKHAKDLIQDKEKLNSCMIELLNEPVIIIIKDRNL